MQATLPYYIGLVVISAMCLLSGVFKEDRGDKEMHGVFAMLLCGLALLLTIGDSLWHHTFYAGHFFGALLGISLGSNLAQSGR